MSKMSIRRHIALKVSLYIIVFVVILQMIGAVISLQTGEWLLTETENSFLQLVQNNLDRQERNSSEQLEELVAFNTKMLNAIVRPILYNLEDVKPTIRGFMEVKEFQAIIVFDESKEPVGAVWRENGSIAQGSDFPSGFEVDAFKSSKTTISNQGETLGRAVLYYTDRLVKDEIKSVQAETLKRLKKSKQKVEEIQADIQFWQVIGLGSIVILFILILFWLISRILKPLKGLARTIQEAEASGILDKRAAVNSQDEIGQTAAAYNNQMASLQLAVAEISKVLKGLSRGDLTLRVAGNQKGDIRELGETINRSLEMLSETIFKVVVASDQVNTGANEMADSSQTLAQGASEQAASLEEASSSMNEVGAQTKTNNETAKQAQTLTDQTLDIVNKGNEQMAAMLNSMNEINKTSTDVTKIIKVIDEIAFQTNLLALNAAVEAARAGKYGKGFAVVAEEVRNLAARSAEAARNTTSLIENSAREVENGVSNAEKTATILNDINESVKKVNEMVGEISTATELQATGIEEINKGLNQINQITQQNSAISEESAAASSELSSQATSLKKLMEEFTVSDDLENETLGIDSQSSQQPSQRMRQLTSESFADEAQAPPAPATQTAPAEKKALKPDPETTIVLDDDDFGKY